MTPLRCPACGSTNVTCESTTTKHEHVCLDCLYTTTAAPVRKP